MAPFACRNITFEFFDILLQSVVHKGYLGGLGFWEISELQTRSFIGFFLLHGAVVLGGVGREETEEISAFGSFAPSGFEPCFDGSVTGGIEELLRVGDDFSFSPASLRVGGEEEGFGVETV